MVRTTNKTKEWIKQNEVLCDMALKKMADDIVIVAKIRVPYEHGDLMDSIEAKRDAPLKHRVIVDSEYASYQELGRRHDGSRIVRHYTTLGSGAHYLRDAGIKISGKALNYLKQAANQLKL